MIKLVMKYEDVPEKRVIKGVRFENGEAILPDGMAAKALAICRYYNVESEMILKRSDINDMVKTKVDAAAVGISVKIVDDDVAEDVDDDVDDDVDVDEYEE